MKRPKPMNPMNTYQFQGTLAFYIFVGGLWSHAGGVWFTTAFASVWGLLLAVVWLIRWGGES